MAVVSVGDVSSFLFFCTFFFFFFSPFYRERERDWNEDIRKINPAATKSRQNVTVTEKQRSQESMACSRHDENNEKK